jgi:Tol biopolymer transport system component
MYIKSVETGETRVVPLPQELNSKKIQWEIVSNAWFPDSTRFVANARRARVVLGSGAVKQDLGLPSSEETSIWVISVPGGRPLKLREHALAYSVSPDGSLISFGANNNVNGDDREIWLMASNGAHARKLFGAREGSAFGSLFWTIDGRRFVFAQVDAAGRAILSRDVKGGPDVTLFSASEMKRIDDFGLALPDGRILYSMRERDIPVATCSYWTLRMDPRTGRPAERPGRLTNWTGYCMSSPSVTKDGKRLAFLKWAIHCTPYMADLTMGGRHLRNLRHFPLSESSDGVIAWTADSRDVINASTRTGEFGLYRQALDEETAVPLVTNGYSRDARVTPDGKWILYFGIGDAAEPLETRVQPVLRVGISGGPPQKLFAARPGADLICARSPAELCAIEEPSNDNKQLIITSLDPLRGRGPELLRFAIDPNENGWGWWWADFSPDGTRVAAIQGRGGPVRILSTDGRLIKEITLKAWSNLQQFTWAADGNGLYVVAVARDRHVLLYLDLQGNAYPIWEGSGSSGETAPRPSPDGQHLAIATWTTSSNMWMMERF